MYLQGNLQNVFDALYHLGVIDPVLEMDWSNALEGRYWTQDDYSAVIEVVNAYQEDVKLLMRHLERFNEEILSFLAMEVAREFADFHSRHDIH